MKAKDLVHSLMEYHGDQILRFDCNARVEVFITQDDLEDACEHLKTEPGTEDEKIAKAKDIAAQLARDRISEVSEVELTADCSWSDVNINKIDWVALVTPEVEEEWDES